MGLDYVILLLGFTLVLRFLLHVAQYDDDPHEAMEKFIFSNPWNVVCVQMMNGVMGVLMTIYSVLQIYTGGVSWLLADIFHQLR